MRLADILTKYDYQLPSELIAQKPATPRESARLLVYSISSKRTKFDTFKNLGKYLPKNTTLVFNHTTVVPARLRVQKTTGGKAEVLYLGQEAGLIKALSNRLLLPGTSVNILRRGKANGQTLKIMRKSDQFYLLKPSFPIKQLPKVLVEFGLTPLPPYIKNSPLSEKQKRTQYQSVFAKAGESVAAPTASLHFSKKLITSLKRQGVKEKFVNLNVGLGTFAPLTEKNYSSGTLHTETYEINAKTFKELSDSKKRKHPIIAVGTTAARTLETAAQTNRLKGSTNIFIKPPYNFRLMDGLITNFHVPKSSLMMLVASLVGRKKLLELYKTAIKKGFRFFSFGDGMLILP